MLTLPEEYEHNLTAPTGSVSVGM